MVTPCISSFTPRVLILHPLQNPHMCLVMLAQSLQCEMVTPLPPLPHPVQVLRVGLRLAPVCVGHKWGKVLRVVSHVLNTGLSGSQRCDLHSPQGLGECSKLAVAITLNPFGLVGRTLSGEQVDLVGGNPRESVGRGEG